VNNVIYRLQAPILVDLFEKLKRNAHNFYPQVKFVFLLCTKRNVVEQNDMNAAIGSDIINFQKIEVRYGP
jgi:hypothetical protein